MHIRPCTADVAAEATDVDPSAVEAPDAGAGSRAVEAASSLEPILLAATAGNGAGSDANDEERAAAGAESAGIVALKAKIKELESVYCCLTLLKTRARAIKYKTANKELRKKH